jgi:hypothetical protein
MFSSVKFSFTSVRGQVQPLDVARVGAFRGRWTKLLWLPPTYGVAKAQGLTCLQPDKPHRWFTVQRPMSCQVASLSRVRHRVDGVVHVEQCAGSGLNRESAPEPAMLSMAAPNRKNIDICHTLVPCACHALAIS